VPVYSSFCCYGIIICFLLQEQRNHDQHKTPVTEFHFESVHSLFLKPVVIPSSYSARSIASFWISTHADTDMKAYFCPFIRVYVQNEGFIKTITEECFRERSLLFSRCFFALAWSLKCGKYEIRYNDNILLNLFRVHPATWVNTPVFMLNCLLISVLLGLRLHSPIRPWAIRLESKYFQFQWNTVALRQLLLL
jgi:hypothetical protein